MELVTWGLWYSGPFEGVIGIWGLAYPSVPSKGL